MRRIKLIMVLRVSKMIYYYVFIFIIILVVIVGEDNIFRVFTL